VNEFSWNRTDVPAWGASDRRESGCGRRIRSCLESVRAEELRLGHGTIRGLALGFKHTIRCRAPRLVHGVLTEVRYAASENSVACGAWGAFGVFDLVVGLWHGQNDCAVSACPDMGDRDVEAA
jgi:hypothetical protein